MFEPQDPPNAFQYPGGPPIPPYDNAGWTLAYQMGLQFDRVLDAFDGPFSAITTDTTTPPAGTLANATGAAGFLLHHRVNDAAGVTNLLPAHQLPASRRPHPLPPNRRSSPAGPL